MPEPMKLESIPQKFRQLAWCVIEKEICSTANYDIDRLDPRVKIEYEEIGEDPYWASYGFDSEKNIGSILESYEFEVQLKLHDEINEYGPEQTSSFIKRVLTQGDYHEVLTLVEFTLRHECCSETCVRSWSRPLVKLPSPTLWTTKTDFPLLCRDRAAKPVKRHSKPSRRSAKQAWKVQQPHLRQAAACINERRFADSVKDSIHAVESVACIIDNKASKTLTPALDSLEKARLLNHPTLKQGFAKLYGYASDEQGIRHALLEKGTSDVDVDEAIFMFGACASFAAYLVNKHRQMKQQQDSGQ